MNEKEKMQKFFEQYIMPKLFKKKRKCEIHFFQRKNQINGRKKKHI